MSDASIKTTQVDFNLKNSKMYELKSDKQMGAAYFKGQNDKLEQVYLKGNNGKNYVIEGENLAINDMKKGAANYTFEFMVDEEYVKASIEKVDDEAGNDASCNNPVTK